MDHFADVSMKIKTTDKYFPAKTNSADGSLTEATAVLKNVWSLAAGIRGIRIPLHQIQSGKSLVDMKNKFILKKYTVAQGLVLFMFHQTMMKNSWLRFEMGGRCFIPQPICYLLFLFIGQTSRYYC